MSLLKSYRTLFLCLIVLFSACSKPTEKDNEGKKKLANSRDLEEIKETGKLLAIIDNSSTSYFIYKGQPMGFEYELLSRFAQHIDVELEVVKIDELSNMFQALEQNQGDVIAANLTVTKDRREMVDFSEPVLTTHQVLVQRQLQSADIQQGKLLIESPVELMHKKIYVQKASSFYNRLVHLSDEIGGDIEIQEVAGNMTVEQLIEKVANHEIDYTVADEHVAKINKAYYRNIHINTALSLEQKVAWAIRKQSANLQIAINEWLNKFKKTVDFRVIYLKYYGNTVLFRNRMNNHLFTSKSGKISNYDDLIKENAQKIGWDWRLLSSMIYQESKFDHSSTSWTGASGLMQLMPNTAAEFGLDSSMTPAQSIETGVKYLKWIDEQFKEKVLDSLERQKFVLAAYNVGLGHVFDAMRLAEKNDLNPQQWDGNTADMLLLKSDPAYYQDTVAHYGYCRGSEPYNYVREIYGRYRDYLNTTENKDELVMLE